jgi:hydroxymethylbilane synthase
MELKEFGGFGAFVKSLEEELLAGRGDLAVHSMKDMPVILPDGCAIASVLPRGPVSDVLVTRCGCGLDSLPQGAVVGTSSIRRRAQAGRVRGDLKFVKCRGNVGTRLALLEKGEVDALIIAEAGLFRLGMSVSGAVRLPFITAAGQGAIAIEVRAGSPEEETARDLNHFETWCETMAERELLRLIGFGCVCPVGVRGEMADGTMRLDAALYSSRGECMEAGVSGRVASAGDALALASRLWGEMRAMPLAALITAPFSMR